MIKLFEKRLPVDAEEQDALLDHDLWCPEFSRMGFICTRGEDHTGDHIAATRVHIVERWPNRDEDSLSEQETT